jgi:hypothetical protein
MLLFHGTKNFCLMGILQSGLQVKAMNADHTGSMFGDGIYLADSFDKSIQYCNDWTFFGEESNRFVFVCEANLGRVYEQPNDKDPVKECPARFDSVKGQGSEGPDYAHLTTLRNGVKVPLGEWI